MGPVTGSRAIGLPWPGESVTLVGEQARHARGTGTQPGQCPRRPPDSPVEAPMQFLFLKDPATDEQLLFRNEHVSAVEIK